MNKEWNVVLMITDGHGHYSGNMDWGTKEFYGLKSRMERLNLVQKGFVKFPNVIAPAVSTIMSIESIMSGIFSAKTHKMHWREWPSWDKFDHPVLSDFLKERGYEVNGFSYLLNSENWLPSIYCYKPELYKEYPSIKRDTHSHEAVLTALRHYFHHAYKGNHRHCFIVHSIFIFDIWEEMMELFFSHGFNYENTIFVLTSDHYFPYRFGRQWLLGERDNAMIFHHSDLTEHNVRVFLYLRYPGSKGKKIDTPVAGYDIAPTILDLIGLRDDWPSKFDGVSLKPLLEGKSIPKRFLRCDNLYPYQVGEKQGRITAITNGKWRYIYRPDPVSSYIAYRLTEEWSTVLQSEEFYNIETDPMERKNLILSKSASVKRKISRFREFFRTTQEDILSFHIEHLRKVFRRENLSIHLFKGKKRGSILCFQSCPDVVFYTIVQVLKQELVDWKIFVITRKSGIELLDPVLESKQIYIYPDEKAYSMDVFRNSLGQLFDMEFDCILNTSSVPLGDFSGVFDESQYPVGDFNNSTQIILLLKAGIKASICLDMNYSMISFVNPFLPNVLFKDLHLKKKIQITMQRVMRKMKPHIKKVWKTFEISGSKISDILSERIIRKQE